MTHSDLLVWSIGSALIFCAVLVKLRKMRIELHFVSALPLVLLIAVWPFALGLCIAVLPIVLVAWALSHLSRKE